VEEFHVITWEAKKEQIFEMPTGGAAIMRQGPNLLKLARKEQCLALLTQLRTKFKTDGFIYRVFPNGEVQYLHPKVGGRAGGRQPGVVPRHPQRRHTGGAGDGRQHRPELAAAVCGSARSAATTPCCRMGGCKRGVQQRVAAECAGAHVARGGRCCQLHGLG
jgi:hypothetical protein